MYNGDRARKLNLVEHGFRPPVRDGQPAADVRGVRALPPPGHLRLRHARRLRARDLWRRRRGADHPPDGHPRSPGRSPPCRRSDRRPAGRDPPARQGWRTRPRDHAHQADVRGPDRLPRQLRRPRPLPPLRHRRAGARGHPPRPPPRRVRRARRHQPLARGARPPRGQPGRHPRRRQGGLPPLGALAHPDGRPRRPQRRLCRHPLRRPRHRLDGAHDGRDRAPPRNPGRPTTRSTASRR